MSVHLYISQGQYYINNLKRASIYIDQSLSILCGINGLLQSTTTKLKKPKYFATEKLDVNKVLKLDFNRRLSKRELFFNSKSILLSKNIAL